MVCRLSQRVVVTSMVAATAALLTSSVAGAATAPAFRGGRPALGPLSASDIARLSAGATQHSIVILKNQHQDVPARPQSSDARARANDSDQAPVVNELNQLHAPGVKRFSVVNAVAATISPAEAQRLSADPAVQAVVPDRMVQPANLDTAGTTSTAGSAQPAGSDPSQPVCPSSPSGYILEPEALQVMKVQNQPGDTTPAAHDLADGHGVKVGIIADGLDINDPDLIRSGSHVVFDYQNFGGDGNSAPTDGREAFLDSGAIASQGNQLYDLSKFVNPAHPTPVSPCNIKIEGVAPGASLAVMNVFPHGGGTFDSTLIQGIDWAVTVDGVDVLNESFGGNPAPDTASDPVAIANANAVAAGVTVDASTGDSGPTNTIGSPASSPGIIAVGGSTTFRVYQQATRYGVQLGGGGWEDNNITALSSSGTTQFGPRTVDVVAPGDRGWELCSADTAHYFGCADFDNGNIGQPIWAAGGTSLSCPLVSGTAALVIQAYASTHGGAHPSPELVKQIIVSSAQDLGAPADHQGAGLVNSLKAVQLAMSIHDANGVPSRVGNTLLSNATSLIATGEPDAHQTFNVGVTNESSASQIVSPSVVELSSSSLSDDKGSVTLGTTPTFVDDRGRTAAYQTHTFNVPRGAEYLNGDIIWQAQAQPGSIVFETLFDPAGRVAAYSLLGEASGHGHVEVREPQAGTWKAVIWTVLKAGPYAGAVKFEYFTQQFETAGAVSPASLSLAAGQTGTFTVSVTAPDSPGDTAYNLKLSTSSGAPDGSIPILLRTLVPLRHKGGSFAGTLTGGATLGQQAAYQFDVPGGKPVLDIGMTLRDANYPILGYLVSPDGEPHNVQSTVIFDAAGNSHGVGRT
ncbi:MAG: S8 family serine peptidase, partial [Candidatus Dormibacteraeota bacterium]|nr:S8 family serine peptidase [Candidatus Dormibacteraeota bacterium]